MVVDLRPKAAGDSFTAGFIKRDYRNGGSIDEGMAWPGHNLAMQVVQKAGAILVVNGEL